MCIRLPTSPRQLCRLVIHQGHLQVEASNVPGVLVLSVGPRLSNRPRLVVTTISQARNGGWTPMSTHSGSTRVARTKKMECVRPRLQPAAGGGTLAGHRDGPLEKGRVDVHDLSCWRLPAGVSGHRHASRSSPADGPSARLELTGQPAQVLNTLPCLSCNKKKLHIACGRTSIVIGSERHAAAFKLWFSDRVCASCCGLHKLSAFWQ